MDHADRTSLVPARAAVIYEGWVARIHTLDSPLVYTSGPEYRDESGLLTILAQLVGLPVTLQHPDGLLKHGRVGHIVGHVASGRLDDDHVVAKIIIEDPEALAAIDGGTIELSLGYQCELDANRFQVGIVLDHLAIVPAGRCLTCELNPNRADTKGYRADAACVAQSVPDATTPSMKVGDMTVALKITLDEESKQILNSLESVTAKPEAECACTSHANLLISTGEQNMDAENQKKLDEALAKVASLESEIEALKASAVKTDEISKLELALSQAGLDLKAETVRADRLATEIESAKADAQTAVTAAQSARTDAEDAAFRAAVDTRVELLEDATKVGIEDAKSKTDRQIKVAIVNKVDEMDIDDTRTPDYVNGMYAGAMKRHLKASASVAEVRIAIVKNDEAAAVADPYKVEAEISATTEAKRKNRWR